MQEHRPGVQLPAWLRGLDARDRPRGLSGLGLALGQGQESQADLRGPNRPPGAAERHDKPGQQHVLHLVAPFVHLMLCRKMSAVAGRKKSFRIK